MTADYCTSEDLARTMTLLGRWKKKERRAAIPIGEGGDRARLP